MNILKRLNNRPPRGNTGDPRSAEVTSRDGDQLPISNYERLDPKQLRTQLSALSQVDLAAIERHELAHQARPVVLNRLHWLKGSEPVPGYDALTTEEILRVLTDADTGTVKAVREYERRHQDRHQVRAELARALPTASASAGEDRAREEQAGLVREGFAGRQKTGLGSRGPAPGDQGRRNGLPVGPTKEGPEG